MQLGSTPSRKFDPWYEDVPVSACSTSPFAGDEAPPAAIPETSMIEQLTELRRLTTTIVRDLDNKARIQTARAFVFACVTHYWRQYTTSIASLEVPTASLGRCLPALAPESEKLAAIVSEKMRPLPLSLASYHISSIYASMLPEAVRSERGVFFTPPALVGRLLDLSEEAGANWENDRVLDPAAGGGAFLAPASMRIADRLCSAGFDSRTILAVIESRVRGIEIDRFSAWMAHVFLEAGLWNHCVAAGKRLRPLIFAMDALTAPDAWFGQSDVLVGNPPFGRVALSPAIRNRFQRSIWGHANLYGVFTDLAIRLARPGGVVGFVTPASFLGGEYFKSLRRLLLQLAPPFAIDFVTDRANVFDGVLQETVLVTLRRGGSASPVSVHFNQPTSLASDCRVTGVGAFDLPSDSGSPWMLPRRESDVRLLNSAAGRSLRLRDYGVEVSTGPFVWNRFKPLLRNVPSDGAYPIVWAEAVSSLGEFSLSANRRGHFPFILVPTRQQHLITRQSCVVLQRTTAKEQSRRLIAAILPQSSIVRYGGVVVENHLNILRIASQSFVNFAPISLAALAALLNSAVVDRIFRSISGSVAVSAFELESLPMPDPSAIDALERQLEIGAGPEAIESGLAAAYESPSMELAFA